MNIRPPPLEIMLQNALQHQNELVALPNNGLRGMTSQTDTQSISLDNFSEGWSTKPPHFYNGKHHSIKVFRFYDGPLTHKAAARRIQKIIRRRINHYRESLAWATEQNYEFGIELYTDRLEFWLANLDYYQRQHGNFML